MYLQLVNMDSKGGHEAVLSFRGNVGIGTTAPTRGGDTLRMSPFENGTTPFGRTVLNRGQVVLRVGLALGHW